MRDRPYFIATILMLAGMASVLLLLWSQHVYGYKHHANFVVAGVSVACLILAGVFRSLSREINGQCPVCYAKHKDT